jgi:formylglycine-generating enzyme required for sulfatase activity
MKSRFLSYLIVSILTAHGLTLLPIEQIAAQGDRRMRVQQATPTERRVALVIGNSAYKDSPLLNPVNDARDMAAALRGMGFEVVLGENLSQTDMKRNIRAFGDRIRNGGVGLFYYAGHGVQVRGSNYLIPVGATITREEEVEYESVDAGLVMAQMEAARNRLNIVIFDACRNNPFVRSFRSTQKGLASIDAPSGTLIAYATAPGSVASDGAGRNGVYTQELLRYMKQPDLSIEQVFKQVRAAVRSRTGGQQTPWESSSLEGDFYFTSTAGATNAANPNQPPAFDPVAVELSFWESIKASTDIEDFKAYLEKYPSGAFAALARNKIRGLEAAAKATGVNTSEPKSNESAGVKPSSGPTASPLPLRGFEFDTMTVNSMGSVTSRRKGQGQYFTEDINGVPLEMVEIPGGTFLMGTSDTEARQVISEFKRYLDGDKKHLAGQWVGEQQPQHRVTVQTFYMGKYEVTQAQWRAVARLPNVSRALVPDPARFKGDNLPVDQVSWEDAVEFCERLSRATGRQYRLPTEAEWEYACRAGSTSPFAFGDTLTPEFINFNGLYPYGAASKGAYRQQPTAVGGLGIANAFGLFDIHGNVWEWCLDSWHENYIGAPSDGRVWESGDPRYRVLRGGSWYFSAIFSRAAFRIRFAPDTRNNFNGFRVVAGAR